MKKWHYKRGGLSWGDNLEVFAFEIWPDKRGDLWWELPYKRGTTVFIFIENIYWGIINVLSEDVSKVIKKTVNITKQDTN